MGINKKKERDQTNSPLSDERIKILGKRTAAAGRNEDYIGSPPAEQDKRERTDRNVGHSKDGPNHPPADNEKMFATLI